MIVFTLLVECVKITVHNTIYLIVEEEKNMEKIQRNITLYVNDNQLNSTAIDRIVVELFNKREKVKAGQTVLLTGCSPLSGTTSTCIGLGIAVANSKRKTLIIDCDVRKALKYKKLNEQTTVGLSNYLLGDSVDLPEVIYNTNIEDLYYIPCGDYLENPTRILCSEKMELLIQKVKERFDCILFDFPALTIVPDAQILFQNVDGIILLASLGETRKREIKETKIKIAPYVGKYYGMIVNKIPLDMYRNSVQNYDYYFVNGRGEQKLNRRSPYKKYKKNISVKEGK